MLLTPKQKEFIRDATKVWNIKIGATGSGKTWLDYNFVIPYRTRELKGKEGLYVIMGVTQTTIERNVLEPMRSIYGEELVGMIRTGVGKVKLFGEDYHVIGAEKISALNKIQGTTIKYCYGDEIVSWNKEVFEMLKSRLRTPHSVFDGTGNPDTPLHYMKKFIDDEKDAGDMYYQEYTIYDNPTLPPDFVTRLEREYDGTVYFDRYILGKWALAEGQIYQSFNDSNIINPELWEQQQVNRHNELEYVHPLRKQIMFVSIGVDFGGSKSANTFQCTGFTRSFQELITVKEKYITEELNPMMLDTYFVNFVKEVIEDGYTIKSIRADSADPVLIRGLNKALRDNKINLIVRGSIKREINDRIRFYTRTINSKRYLVVGSCKETISAFKNAVWDATKFEDTRLDDGTTNIDTLDAQEYSTEEYHNLIMKVGA